MMGERDQAMIWLSGVAKPSWALSYQTWEIPKWPPESHGSQIQSSEACGSAHDILSPKSLKKFDDL